jgi:hypothetical protein
VHPLTETIHAGGGIGKQLPDIRIFFAGVGRLPKKSHCLILIYFQLLNVNFVSDHRNILSLSTVSRTGGIGGKNVRLFLTEPLVLTGQVGRLTNRVKSTCGICTLVCNEKALNRQRVESFC